MTTTRTIVLSTRKIANMGAAYTDTFLGLPVLWTDWDGITHAGTITSFRAGYPVATLTDGRTARMNLTILTTATRKA